MTYLLFLSKSWLRLVWGILSRLVQKGPKSPLEKLADMLLEPILNASMCYRNFAIPVDYPWRQVLCNFDQNNEVLQVHHHKETSWKECGK